MRIGIVGGSGQLGGAIARAWLRAGVVAPGDLWISNRSGAASCFDDCPGLNLTIDNAALAAACDTVLLSVPPHLAAGLGLDLSGKLVLSVMAGQNIADLEAQTGAARVIRAMSSPAADIGLAYSPWIGSGAVSEADKALVTRLFTACGETDEVASEDQIDHFTALTGPVPGFVAYFAECMSRYAVKHGIAPEIADKAMRQLFLASGTVMAQTKASPAQFVQEMIDYAGTTAAGLTAMEASPLASAVEEGLHAAYQKTKDIAEG